MGTEHFTPNSKLLASIFTIISKKGFMEKHPGELIYVEKLPYKPFLIHRELVLGQETGLGNSSGRPGLVPS